jgi:hypothetical protein
MMQYLTLLKVTSPACIAGIQYKFGRKKIWKRKIEP